RFAPNLVCLPEGYVFSRLSPGLAARVLAEYLRGSLVLEACRGRSGLEPPLQAAEILLRIEHGRTAIADVVAAGRGVKVIERAVGEAPDSCLGEPVPVVNYD